jgi:aryl-alcohol dehydrogenase-like predicted oxidoreductase
MEYAALGSRGCRVSRIGFGCAAASGYDYGQVDEGAWTKTVRAALDHGINFFDVADVYGFGRAEELLSRALGEQRHQVVLATKFGLAWDSQGSVRRDASPEHIEHALNESLRRLRVDSIALYQLHWPDPATPLEEVLEILKHFQHEGKIQCIGLSNVTLNQLEAHSKGPLESGNGVPSIDSVQVAYNLLCRSIEEDILAWCESRQIAILAHSGLARGLLSGKRSPGFRFEGPDTRNQSGYFALEGQEQKQALVEALREVGRRTGCSPSAVALRWVLDHRQITSVMVGMNNPTQLEENLQSVGWRLPPADYDLLTLRSASCPGSLAGSLAHRGSNT